MTAVVGVFDDRRSAVAAEQLLDEAGFGERVEAAHALADDGFGTPRLARRGETMLRAAIEWGIWGSLIVEVPALAALLLFPLDMNVKILLAATVWKFGAAFGAWLGAMAVTDDGVDDEIADAYEAHLEQGRALLAVDVAPRLRPGVRGLMLESGALHVRDVRGRLVLERSPKAPARLPV